MEAVEPHYDGLCKSFYFFAISNDDMPDNKSCVITFDGFKKLCKRIGVTDLVQLHIEARKESGELPQYLRFVRLPAVDMGFPTSRRRCWHSLLLYATFRARP